MNVPSAIINLRAVQDLMSAAFLFFLKEINEKKAAKIKRIEFFRCYGVS